jgi:hypothetical protein
VPAQHAKDLAARISRSRLRVYPGQGHISILDHPIKEIVETLLVTYQGRRGVRDRRPTERHSREAVERLIAAQVGYDAPTHKATLNPNDTLKRGVTYKAVVSTVAKDVAGNRLDQDESTTGLQQKVWYFTVDD